MPLLFADSDRLLMEPLLDISNYAATTTTTGKAEYWWTLSRFALMTIDLTTTTTSTRRGLQPLPVAPPRKSNPWILIYAAATTTGRSMPRNHSSPNQIPGYSSSSLLSLLFFPPLLLFHFQPWLYLLQTAQIEIEIENQMEFRGGESHNASNPHWRKKRYHRHSTHQIQRLEGLFKEFPHPDEKTRSMLSRELGLHPRQIKFWFQNRRTQMKAQRERTDNCALRAENDKMRCETIAIREALKNVFCPSCGGLPVSEDSYFDEQKLRVENAQLKEELDRVFSIAAKKAYFTAPPMQPIHISSLDLSVASSTFVGQGIPGHSLDLDLNLLPGSSSSVIPNLVFPTMSISDMDKSLMADIAANAMDELISLLQGNESLWINSGGNDREVLNLDSYERIFPRPNAHFKNPNIRIEASRDSGIVVMNGLALVDIFIDVNKWMESFPTIVLKVRTIEVMSSSEMVGRQSGPIKLMHEELQVLSALVPTRQLYLLRFCQQIEQGSWAIVDVSYQDRIRQHESHSFCKAHRLPSGCLLHDMSNGYSKVTWVEH